MATVTVTLFVNTGAISNQSNVDANSSFGQPQNITNENFTINPNTLDNIIWQGFSSSAPSTDAVNITSIVYEGAYNVFGSNQPNGNKQNPEKVLGTVANHTNGETEVYKIFFTVSNNGVLKNQQFHIDPIIQVKP